MYRGEQGLPHVSSASACVLSFSPGAEPLSPYDQALAVPKVALLFLTQGVVHHAETWALWFASAAGHIPLANLRQAGCDAWHRSILGPLGACDSSVGPKEAAELDPEDIIGAQHLFSVYLHVPLDRDGEDIEWVLQAPCVFE